MQQSKALEANLRESRVRVTIDPKYSVLQEIISEYHGLLESLNAFLLEACHPYKNWEYILTEGRRFTLHNFNLFKTHSRGPEGARLFLELFLEALDQARRPDLKTDAADNLLVYLQHIITESDDRLPAFLSMMDGVFEQLSALPEEFFVYIMRSFYGVNRLAGQLFTTALPETDFKRLDRLLVRYLEDTYQYWLGEPDPQHWFEKETGRALGAKGLTELFIPITHKTLQTHLDRLNGARNRPEQGSPAVLTDLAKLPGFRDIVALYEQIPKKLARAGAPDGFGEQWLLIFQFHMMTLEGLSSIHERTLRDINRALTRLIGREPVALSRRLIRKTFTNLLNGLDRFPATVLHLVENIGQAVYRTNDPESVEDFIGSVIELGFQPPRVEGVGNDWEIKANPTHIQNIRTWLRLIEMHPSRSKRLISALIIHLALEGVFIKDTDLFPRDITALLNSDVRPVYNLVKQLGRLFPSYFNEIGAEGRLRDTSTRLDEILRRRDPLVHFLRKQSHVESNPRTVTLMEEVLTFWLTRDKAPLAQLVPPAIYSQIKTEGRDVDGMHRLLTHMISEGIIQNARGLICLPDDYPDPDTPGVTGEDRERLHLAHDLYRMLYQKYHTDDVGLVDYLTQIEHFFRQDLTPLKNALAEPKPRDSLVGLLDYLEGLKDLIFSEETFEIHENIYVKRHIAVDIPSMYGSYHEARFDALGLTFRLEAKVNTLFQLLIDNIDLKLITRAVIVRIHDYLKLFNRALRLDGIHSREFEHQLELLDHSLNIRGFSFTQYVDIFRGLSQAVSNIVNDYFNNVHHNQLGPILDHLTGDRFLDKYHTPDHPISDKEDRDRVIEIFLRDRVADSLGLQQLDQFVTRVLNTIVQQDYELHRDSLRRLFNYDPARAFTPLSPAQPDIADVIHLGSKGLNLVKLIAIGLPVPPGFIITTEVFRCREVIDGYGPAREHFQELIARHIRLLEQQTGLAFGDPGNPLILSVRSGSSISQPGMLSTFLDVGLNEDIVAGMAESANGGAWFAYDCYRRFLQSIGMARGMERDHFDAVISDFKQRYGLPYKREFSGEQMREVALAYRDLIRDHGIEIDNDPYEQLYLAIQGVFDSWNAPRAQTYRHIMGISSDWGTAVTVQRMVFGNLSGRSGAGVVFTHNPRWSENRLMPWGDFTLYNQGEDVVSGLVETLPISELQAEIEKRNTSITLQTDFPEIYRRLYQLSEHLVDDQGYSPQEIEFTFEGPKKDSLFILQNRDMVRRERKEHHGFDRSEVPAEDVLGHGIGVSGGALAGRIVFSLEEIKGWRDREVETPLILVRGDTVPDDIREIHASDGLLTARGGSTSHAAIVAYRLNKTCIVGCADMDCNEQDKYCRIGRAALHAGDWISMDGLSGFIYKGQVRNAEQS